jgi:hypothetical protein
MEHRRMLIAGVAVGLVLAMVGIWRLGSWVYEREARPSDPDRAVAEVQRYYDRREERAVIVLACEWLVSESDYDDYACDIAIRCDARVTFSVPRAAALVERQDFDASPNARERTRC